MVRWRREQMNMPKEPLKVEQNPTPRDEAREFENPDERAKAAARGHELALLKAKTGWIGRLTGSTNESMNTGLLLLLICLALLGFSIIVNAEGIPGFSGITDNLFKLVLTLAGYVFGTGRNSSQSQ